MKCDFSQWYTGCIQNIKTYNTKYKMERKKH